MVEKKEQKDTHTHIICCVTVKRPQQTWTEFNVFLVCCADSLVLINRLDIGHRLPASRFLIICCQFLIHHWM